MSECLIGGELHYIQLVYTSINMLSLVTLVADKVFFSCTASLKLYSPELHPPSNRQLVVFGMA